MNKQKALHQLNLKINSITNRARKLGIDGNFAQQFLLGILKISTTGRNRTIQNLMLIWFACLLYIQFYAW